MGNGNQFSGFKELVRSDYKIRSVKTNALSDIQVRKYDSDFDIAAAICDMVDEMVIEYLEAYHEWLRHQQR